MLRLAVRAAPPYRRPWPLLDNHGRTINYLRLAVTDRCNLRCHYCMPEKGVPFLPHDRILRFEEMLRLARIFANLGVGKIRVTGGEPFVRKGCVDLLRGLAAMPGVEALHITTNGVEVGSSLDALAELGLAGINLSLDTLDSQRFRQIARRDSLEPVLRTMQGILDRGIPLKINSVVLADTSDAEILRLADLVRDFPITLRFIERMPFSGRTQSEDLRGGGLLARLQCLFPALQPRPYIPPATARLFDLPGCKGRLGIIEGYSRHFCSTCNKVRVTPAGLLKTCLYDNGVLDLRTLLRNGSDDRQIAETIVACVQNRFSNGHEAERFSGRDSEPSMAGIGG